MQWKAVCLITMLVITTPAIAISFVSTIEHDPIIVNTTEESNESSVTIVNIPVSPEVEAMPTTNIYTASLPSTTDRTISIVASTDDALGNTKEGELSSRDASDGKGTLLDSSIQDDGEIMVPPPESECVEGDDDCENGVNDEGDYLGDEGIEDEEGVVDEEQGIGDEDENIGDDEEVIGDEEQDIKGDDDDESPAGGNGDEENVDSAGDEDLIIVTKSGPVQGWQWQGNENIISYLDIPYGTIINSFQVATPANEWENVHSVKDHNKRCPQLQETTYIGDIDCLTLSIFKPLIAKDASVLFHIHAENFNTGSGDPSIYGPEYLVDNGIILVLPNYRLGPFGFLCMQNGTAPGNMALKDLTLALDWVSDNIEAFGGDPKNIAVSGDGKSGALAGLLAISPKSRTYINKVIAESGSLLSYWALDRDPVKAATELLENLSEVENTRTRINISLREFSAPAIVKAGKDIEFRPCLENDEETGFMVQTPYEIISNEKFEETSFLIGSAKYAGVHEALLQTEESIQKLNEDYALLLPEDLEFETLTLKRETGSKVKTQYFGEDDISKGNLEKLTLCFTDMGYLGPGIRSARLLVDAGATAYFYEFSFVGDMNRVLGSIDHPVEGAVRGDIVGYLFTQNGVLPSEEQAAEKKMIETLTEMWTSFLKTGVPSAESIEWNQLKAKDHLEEEWLLIDSEPKMQQGLHVDRLLLWTEIYDNHYIDGNHGNELSPSVYTVLILQLIFWLAFCKNVSHIY